jgi:rhodanese-related sulfurtransferase
METKQVSTKEAHEALTNETTAVYLDVRTEKEFEQGHPLGALNVPVLFFDPAGGPARPNERFLDVVRRHIEPSRTVFVGCQSGMRSQRAAEMLSGAGYRNVANVSGGFGGLRDRSGKVLAEGWRDTGLPIENGQTAGRCYRDLASKRD